MASRCGLQRREAFGFDGGLVHEGVVEIGDLAGLLGGGCSTFGGLGDQVGDAFVGFIGNRQGERSSCAVGGNFGVLEPLTVGVLIKVVAWADGAVHVGQVHGGPCGQSGLGRLFFGRICGTGGEQWKQDYCASKSKRQG